MKDSGEWKKFDQAATQLIGEESQVCATRIAKIIQDGTAKPVQALIQLNDYKPVAKLEAVQNVANEDNMVKII